MIEPDEFSLSCNIALLDLNLAPKCQKPFGDVVCGKCLIQKNICQSMRPDRMSSGKAGQSGITLVFSDSKSGSGNLTYMSSMIRKCPSCCTTAWDCDGISLATMAPTFHQSYLVNPTQV